MDDIKVTVSMSTLKSIYGQVAEAHDILVKGTDYAKMHVPYILEIAVVELKTLVGEHLS